MAGPVQARGPHLLRYGYSRILTRSDVSTTAGVCGDLPTQITPCCRTQPAVSSARGRPTTIAPAKQHEWPGWSPGRVRGSNTPRTGRSGEDAREGVVEFAGVVENALGELVDGPVDRREVVLDPVAQSG